MTITSDEFLKKFGSPPKSLGIQESKIDALVLTCETVYTYTPLAELKVLPR